MSVTSMAPPAAVRSLYTRLHAGSAIEAESVALQVGLAAQEQGLAVTVVSACLVGEPTRYDGGDKLCPATVNPLINDPNVLVLPLCPEILGGMGCPRAPVHFAIGDGEALLSGGDAKVVTADGLDHTAALQRGAARAERLALIAGATKSVLKERSPSCGVTTVHGPDGLRAGRGAFAARLRRHGLVVQAELESIGDAPA